MSTVQEPQNSIGTCFGPFVMVIRPLQDLGDVWGLSLSEFDTPRKGCIYNIPNPLNPNPTHLIFGFRV